MATVVLGVLCPESPRETPTEKYLGCDVAGFEYWLHGGHVYRRGKLGVRRLYPPLSNRSLTTNDGRNKASSSFRRASNAEEA
jgi:hypothetical protein